MVKINTNFSKLNASLKQMGAELNFRYHFNNNKSDIALTRSKFNSDGTFNSSTSAFGGMSRWGNWEKVDNDKIKLITTRISTNSNSDKVPPPQTIYIMSNGGLKIGSTIYIKDKQL